MKFTLRLWFLLLPAINVEWRMCTLGVAEKEYEQSPYDYEGPIRWWLDTNYTNPMPEENDPRYRFKKISPTSIHDKEFVRVEFEADAPNPLDFVVGKADFA